MISTMNALKLCNQKRKRDCGCTDNRSFKNKTRGYKESDFLGGLELGAFQSAADIAISFYVKSFFSKKNNKIIISIARAGNVIGGGDWSMIDYYQIVSNRG